MFCSDNSLTMPQIAPGPTLDLVLISYIIELSLHLLFEAQGTSQDPVASSLNITSVVSYWISWSSGFTLAENVFLIIYCTWVLGKKECKCMYLI